MIDLHADFRGMASMARFSDDHRYRFRLERRWGDGPPLVFVMLNPSLAAHDATDPTVSSCVNRARDWGFGGIVVVNLFALVSPYPTALIHHPDPIGQGNDDQIAAAAQEAGRIVCAWGGDHRFRDRADRVADVLAETGAPLFCLDQCAGGAPRHPRAVPRALPLRPWPI
jgi:hypothetical protein